MWLFPAACEGIDISPPPDCQVNNTATENPIQNLICFFAPFFPRSPFSELGEQQSQSKKANMRATERYDPHLVGEKGNIVMGTNKDLR